MKGQLQPFYSLEQLAEMGVHKLRTWQLIAKNYQGYFTKIGTRTVISQKNLDLLLDLGELETLPMTSQARRALHNQKMASSGQGR